MHYNIFLVLGTGIEPARCFQHLIFVLHTLIYSCTAIYMVCSLEHVFTMPNINSGLGSRSMFSTHLQVISNLI